MIRRRIKILWRAAILFHCGDLRVTCIHGRATQPQQMRQQLLHVRRLRRFHFQAKVGRLGVSPTDAELLHFEPALMLYHRIEDLLHQVRIDQMAFGFDHFLLHG